MNRLLLILLLIATTVTQAAFADKGDRWRVSDQDLSVWSSPDYLEKLGTIHKGYEITENGLDGDMIQFCYNGQTAYVATYCCERIANEVAPQETAVAPQETVKKESTTPHPSKTATAKKATQPTIEIAQRTEKEQKEDVSAGAIALSVPLLLISLVGMCISLIAIVFTLFYVFKYKTLAAWFNKKCETEVIPYKRMNSLLWPPIIAALAMAILGGGINYLIMLGATENEDLQILLVILGVLLTLAIPFFVLRHVYIKNKHQYGKKAARWMMVYSLLSITAIYLCCVVVAYIVIGILALLLFILIICLCFPTRYYIVRRW